VDGSWYYGKMDAGGSICMSEWRYASYEQYGSTWYWFDASGKMVANRWIKQNGIWYYLRPSGAMASNYWVKSGGKWYYCNKSGDMAVNQWILTGSYWYYVGSDGAMLTNTTTPDGYKVDAQGRWKKF
jgi:beta-galactosidase